MRTNARSLSAVASALLFAASAASLSGCCCSKGKMQADGAKGLTRNTVIVIVSYDSETGKARISDADKNLELCERSQDFVKWISAYGTVHILTDSWKPRLPFPSPPAPDPSDRNVLKGGPPSPHSGNQGGAPCRDSQGNAAQCYEYTAWLWLWSDPQGTKPIKIDPRIVILP